MKPIISGSGIRGIFGRSLTVENAAAFAAAFGNLCGMGPVVVGRDTRSSGPAMEAAVSAGLMSVGCSPVRMGVVTTPTVQLEAMREGIVGGIAITSSHNPGEWNALKLIGPDGVFLRGPQRNRLMEILKEGQRYCDYKSVGVPGTLEGSLQRHVDGVVSIPIVRRTGRKLKAVLDVTGGTAATFAPMLMEALEIDYSVINPEMLPEGDFPRVAEPTVESLKQLSNEVVKMKADIGFAFDPDGDRLAMVDQSGRVIGEDYTVALAFDYVLEREPGPAVVNLSTSMLARDAAERHGCMLYRSPVGEVNVVEEMEDRGSMAGGEGNGGVIYRPFHAGRDSGVAIAFAVSYLRSNPDSTLGSWADGYASYIMTKKKLPLKGDFDEVKKRLEDIFKEPDDCRDGLWYERAGGWMHIRPSGTEPVVRYIAENSRRDYIERDYGIFQEVMESICVE